MPDGKKLVIGARSWENPVVASNEICPNCGANLVSLRDYQDHLTQRNCIAAGGSMRVYPGWRESMDDHY